MVGVGDAEKINEHVYKSRIPKPVNLKELHEKTVYIGPNPR